MRFEPCDSSLRRLMLEHGKANRTPRWTHRMRLRAMAEAYELCQARREGVLKIRGDALKRTDRGERITQYGAQTE